MRRLLLVLLACALATVALAVTPAGAGAHASLEASRPQRGARLAAPPREVRLRFSEPVEAAFGAVRVFDAAGRSVPVRSETRRSTVVARLPAALPEGGYTVTYRVISADSHPVSSGFVFSVGTVGAASGVTVDELLDRQGKAGSVTTAALGAARAAQYAALALGLGAFVFLLVCWGPAVRATAGDGAEWTRAGVAFAARLRALLLCAAAVGAVSAAAAIALQGAVAGAITVWSALDAQTVGAVLATRFGTVWGAGLLAWLGVGVAALLLGRRPAVLALPLGALALLPALGGHAATQQPAWLMLAVNVLHVVAVSAWAGGAAVLLLALRTATAGLDAEDRTRLLVAAVGRFSTLAGAAVALVLLTGIAQALVSVAAWGALLDTAYGRSVLVKLGLFVLLVGLGATYRARVLPPLRRLAASSAAPGAVGARLRRLLRVEAALFAAVLGVTGALATYAPSTAVSSGPFSARATLGPARLEATVEPARAGLNELHLYLFDRTDGSQFDATRELTVTAEHPAKGIAPIELGPSRAGPGHYVVGGAPLTVPGEWRLEVTSRVSDFDQYATSFAVPVR